MAGTPPPLSSPTPPSSSSSASPASSIPPPPPASAIPPLLSSPLPPVVVLPPLASAIAPSPASPSPPPPTALSPPPSSPPPQPALSPPPLMSPPPPLLPSSPLPSSLPPVGSPPAIVPSPSPAKPQSPPPLPPPPPLATLPISPSQPPPLANPPTGSPPPPPVPQSPPPSQSETPPSNPSASPPKNRPPSDPSAPPLPMDKPPSAPSPPSSPPNNSSGNIIPSTPSESSPPIHDIPLPLPSPTNPSGNPTAPASPGATGTIVPIAVVASLFMLCLVGVALWYTKRRRKQVGGYNAGFLMPSPSSSSQISESSYSRSPVDPFMYHSFGNNGVINSPPNSGLGNSKSWFTYGELYNITNGFSAENLLGEGGFGCVYKGCLPDGREVAVKQLKAGSGQGEREFKAEVEIISRVHHRHLVSLVGYCIVENQRLLVYDYVPNNTLHYHIHEKKSAAMDWATRIKVAAGAARGIAYLHEDCHPRIIHRDIKSSNILIDNNFEAQVCDFGLARLAMDAATHVTTRVMGTFGYLAPEYASTGKLTERSDVYSFGVVLLELITGRKPVDQSLPFGDESLVEWARPLLTHALDTGDLGDLPDRRLEKNYNEREMFRMIEAAAACIRHSASMRPKMGLVMRVLDSVTESDLNNGVIPGQSALFVAPQSAEIRMFQRLAFDSQDYSGDYSRSSWRSRSELETSSHRP